MKKDQISSVVRALQILECFMNGKAEWTLKELTQELDLPSTTVFRQLSTLVDCNYLEQNSGRKSYKIGARLLQLSGAVISQADLRQTARPILERLSNAVRETVNLSTLIEHDIFYLDKVEEYRSVICHTRIGSRVPAYATSCGKAMLAYAPENVVEEYCTWISACPPLTDATISDPETFRRELAETRLRGYAMDNGEIETGLICIGAPIFDAFRHAVAAVSVAGPEFRMKENQEMIIREVKRAAMDISRFMGYHE